ncbi:SAM-dependent methyltransferase [Acrocarpospora corrugata]|uniref:SAM-dependent methyltransferase n=1 Tax=Acrocarpospora corrugata TaxID=35763 RepID=A0A5M3VS93_9ACTN|nr:SAM-dependent methyltransferase [Acrocarpospora corrugata]GER99634.1 SAM-dependent methyltransferase [Acrocarpospora corrugata]
MIPAGTGPRTPSATRVHDALLGGKENFEVDRAVADRLAQILPDIGKMALSNQAFVGRALHHLHRAGIRQFLDVSSGAGLAAVRATHDTLRVMDPGIRVAYVDTDPMVLAHARLLVDEAGTPLRETTALIRADMRRPELVLGHPEVRTLLDLTRPVALLAAGILHLYPDTDDPQGIVRGYMDKLAPGSHLVATNMHASGEATTIALQQAFQLAVGTGWFRTRTAIEGFFEGLDLVEPGIVHLAGWHPDEPHELAPWERIVLGGVARKP